jgi:hypothetical protein
MISEIKLFSFSEVISCGLDLKTLEYYITNSSTFSLSLLIKLSSCFLVVEHCVYGHFNLLVVLRRKYLIAVIILNMLRYFYVLWFHSNTFLNALIVQFNLVFNVGHLLICHSLRSFLFLLVHLYCRRMFNTDVLKIGTRRCRVLGNLLYSIVNS